MGTKLEIVNRSAFSVVCFGTVTRRWLPICAFVVVLSQLAVASAHLLHHHDHERNGTPSAVHPCAVCMLTTAPTDLDTREVAVVPTGERVETVVLFAEHVAPRSLPTLRARGPPA